MKYVLDDLASFKVTHAMDGVSVTMNSTIIEAYFKKFSKIEYGSYESEWSGHRPYNIPPFITSYYNHCLSGWKNLSLYYASSKDRPNMSFLRCEGLKDGIEVVIRTPCTESYLERYKKMLGKTILAFYYSEIAPRFKNKPNANIPFRYRDIYNYLEFRGYTMGLVTSRKLGQLTNSLRIHLEGMNIAEDEIKRRLKSHVA